MKKLRSFLKFDAEAFFGKHKELLVLEVKPHREFGGSDAVIGTKVTCVIITDKSVIRTADGDISNLNVFEKLDIKIDQVGFDIPINSQIHLKPSEITCTVYGDYQNMISVKGSKNCFEIIQNKQPNQGVQ